ncbi:hypothetical protein GCM10008934_16420 [Virgibacillus salarius]|uniref:hypothetical protein n=1 Tax=Virgibacillus salarius TaxID=447199 RepID=UPI0031DD7BBF
MATKRIKAEQIRKEYLSENLTERSQLAKGLREIRQLDDKEPFKKEVEELFKAAIAGDLEKLERLFGEYVDKYELLLILTAHMKGGANNVYR